ncbi:MAG: transglutaminase family protein [Cellvibrionaceae bacterium]|nr:transglutaminase family protein [Cellvibrionaceae bacterium]MCV6626193.1 transglutaminase family protein [Cellvibrionaceae bacterium]
MNKSMQEYLQPTEFIQSTHPAVVSFAEAHAQGETDLEKAVSVYYAVRDKIFYDPFTASLERQGFKASHVLEVGRAWCVPKAILLAACYRHLGIPARLGFADVTNHLSTEKMRQAMQTDIFYWHGYTSVYLQGQWLKATPAFNLSLCEKFGLKPLEFNGREDSLYHEFDQQGNKHMEYLNERGDYADLPYQELMSDFKRYYPGMVALMGVDFDEEVAKEIGDK